MTWDDEEARRQVARTEELLAALDTLPDHAAATRAHEAVRALVDLYGQCLHRVLAHLTQDGDAVRRLTADELIGPLLLAHDLHPDPVPVRVRAALDAVRPALSRQGATVELLEVDGTVVRVRLLQGG